MELERDRERCGLLEDKLFELAGGGNLQAIKFWLERRQPSRWGDVAEEISAEKGLNIANLADMILHPIERIFADEAGKD